MFDDEDWAAAPHITELAAPEGGWIGSISADAVGELVVDLGGGRRVKTASVDPRVGVETLVEVGSRVEKGQPLFRVHSAEPWEGRAEDLASISGSETRVRPVLLEA